MRTLELREAVERHRRLLRCTTVHLLADEKETLVGSSLVSGHVMRTRIGGNASALNCIVNAEVLASMLAGDHEVDLSDSGSDLHVRCGKNRGSVPSNQSEEPPEVPPRMAAGTAISGDDLAWLRGAMKRIALGKCQSDGSTNIESSDGRMCVCTYDEVYGAFAWRESACSIGIGLMPSDASLLSSMMDDEDLTIAMSGDNRVLVENARDVLAFPCIRAGAQKENVVVGGTKPHWITSGRHLAAIVKSVGVVARTKDAGPVRIVARNGAIAMSASASSGNLVRALPGRVARDHVPLNCNIVLLQDVVDRMRPEQRVTAWVEPGDAQSARLVLRTDDTTYVILTSSG